MATTITPKNYGLLPYGTQSYAAYLSTTVVPPNVFTRPVVETLISTLAPAAVKLYFQIEE